MAASFQTPAMAGEGPERADDSFRYEAPITRPMAAPVAGYEIVTGDPVTVPAGQSREGFATCLGGRRVLGGGWTADTASDLSVISNRAAANGVVWRVTFFNPTDVDLTATVTAQCAFVRESDRSE
ncbi:hypothetical protein AB0G05_01685 [Nonomuraea wenchangensis]